MTEPIEKQDVEEPEVEEEAKPDEKKEPEPQGKKARTFSQDEVDRLVQNRLRKEKETSKTTIDALTSDVTFYEEQMAKVIEAQTADWGKGMKALFLALPVKEQLAKLADEDFMADVHKDKAPSYPRTPKEQGQGTPTFNHKFPRI